MTDDDIFTVAHKCRLSIGIRPPSKLTDMGNGTLKFMRQEGLTIFGENLLAFAKMIEATERERINALLAAIREHWIKANGEGSLSVSALDQIAEVIADGSYVLPTHDPMDTQWLEEQARSERGRIAGPAWPYEESKP
jgi:hypothetical protein